MLLIRRFEEEAERLYRRGLVRGFLHTYIGEEAIAVGAIPALREDDYVIGHYRDHGHALARGIDPKAAMAELCGKATGCSGGKGGSMHLFDVDKHFMGGHAIVGGQLPLAIGIALGLKLKGTDSVVMCFFGDGAVNEGEFHEAMNMASLWKLPVVFMLENNLYGMGTDVNRSRAGGASIY
ncbi:thiamine pyrophosphate-dependent enzyme, partial [Chloroflexi bacterium]|nr:thiamine pyrophosphate-dependent enzyme [Chloroflexota bacterium]